MDTLSDCRVGIREQLQREVRKLVAQFRREHLCSPTELELGYLVALHRGRAVIGHGDEVEGLPVTAINQTNPHIVKVLYRSDYNPTIHTSTSW